MRNVTIVESNIEPNKEHLWFYRGELKWFGPNGWETVTTSDIEPKYIFKKNSSIESLQFDLANGNNGITVEVLSYTESKGIKKEVPISVSFQSGGTIASTDNIYYNPIGIYNPSIFPKSVGYDIAFIKGAEGRSIIIPITVVNTSNTTTTTTSTPVPSTSTTTSTVYLANSIKFTNNTNVNIMIQGAMYSTGESISPPIQPEQTCILGYNQGTVRVFVAGSQVTPFDSLKITAIKDGVTEDVPYELQTDNSTYYQYEFSFKELVEKEITEVTIEGSAGGASTTTSTTSSTTTLLPDIETSIPVYLHSELSSSSIEATSSTQGDLSLIDSSEYQKLHGIDDLVYIPLSPISRRYLAIKQAGGYQGKIVVVFENADAGQMVWTRTLYPIEEVMDDTGTKKYLFDVQPLYGIGLSSVDGLSVHVYNSTTISTIPPFIDGSIPPFADEE